MRKLSSDTLGRQARDAALAQPVSALGALLEPSDGFAAARVHGGGAAATCDRNDSLLARYRKRPSARLRNQLIERYRGMVEAMARALAQRLPPSVDPQDLVHAGIWGLIRALSSYEPARGATFVPFLRLRVRGAMLDELRHTDRFARAQRQRARRREAVVERLRAELQREPSDAELADALGLSERHYRLRFVGDGAARVQEFADGAEELADASAETPGEGLDRADLLRRIEASLHPIEWRVLRLHYLDGLSGKEIARKLRLSPARVCQIHVRVLSRLKAKLGEVD